MKQIEMVSLDGLVSVDHRYRSFMKLWNFQEVDQSLAAEKSNNPNEGYGLEKLFRCLSAIS